MSSLKQVPKLGVFLLLSLAFGYGQNNYSVTEIPNPTGAGQLVPQKMNNSGQVAGYIGGAGLIYAPCGSRGFVYSGGQTTMINPLPTALNTASCPAGAAAYYIDDAGNVVGSSSSADTDPNSGNRVLGHAFLYNNGQIQDLNNAQTASTGFTLLSASAGNNGVIGGLMIPPFVEGPSANDPGFFHSYMLNQGTLTDANNFFATGINKSGDAAGLDDIDGEPGAVSYWHNGTMTRVGHDADLSMPRINDTGQVLGSAFIGGSDGFIWQPSQPEIDIPPLAGDTTSVALAINSSGVVVGYSMPDSQDAWHYLIWDSVNGSRDLNAMISATGWVIQLPQLPGRQPGFTTLDINDSGQVMAYGSHNGGPLTPIILTPASAPTPTGSNVPVTVGSTTLTFSNVSSGGTTTVAPTDPATINSVPGGFAVSSTIAYEISTTASFSGPVTLAFKVPGPISATDFANLRIYHNENGTLVDVTASTPPPDYSTLTIYGTTTSFSPFYLVRGGPHVMPLFDTSKPSLAGSTIPVRVALLDQQNQNIGSTTTTLTARGLTLLITGTDGKVKASGKANPGGVFRFDSGAYIYNLDTTGLSAGKYVLSLYLGSERNYFYTVPFTLK